MKPDEAKVHACVDDELPPGERREVEAALRGNPEASRRVDAFLAQRRALHGRFDPVLAEPVPERLRVRPPAFGGLARAAGLVGAGIAIGVAASVGWYAGRPSAPAASAPAPALLPARAARAHVVYAVEVRHPVEVEAAQQEHLVQWLSKRLGTPLKVPVLTEEGFELLGGRLLPGPEGAVAQFMYQDAGGKRLTLYVSARGKSESQTAFRFAQEGGVSVFYWIDGNWGYALSADADKGALSRVATSVYRQLNP